MGVLRILLALSVVATHLRQGWAEPGDHAVSLFFILSGFYMALVLNEKYPPGPSGYVQFAKARILRLFPTYLLVLVLTLLVSAIGARLPGAHPPPDADFFARWSQLKLSSALFLIATNLFLFGQDVVMFLRVSASGGLEFTRDFWADKTPAYPYLVIPPAWSLSMELMFYALAPLIVRRSAWWIAALAAGSFGLKVYLALALGLKGDPWSYRFFPSALCFFLLGALAYKVVREIRTWERLPGWTAAIPVAGIASVALWAALHAKLPRYAWPLQVGLITASLPVAFCLWGRNRADRWVGELSYPIYISHLFVMGFLGLFSVDSPPITVVCVVGFSIVLFYFVEHPVETFRQKLFAKGVARAGRP